MTLESDAHEARVMSALSPPEIQFVEQQGLFFERLGFSRIQARVLALLLVAERPLDQDEVCARLTVSRASVHTSTRILIVLGLVERVPGLGDRRTCFRWSPQAWERVFEAIVTQCRNGALLARAGLEAVASDNHAARGRLDATSQLAEFLMAETLAASHEWGRRQAGKGAGR
jgi:DNA-binding transcriptional regulator GbsR (MarR family)